jgi:hypothetical protein
MDIQVWRTSPAPTSRRPCPELPEQASCAQVRSAPLPWLASWLAMAAPSPDHASSIALKVGYALAGRPDPAATHHAHRACLTPKPRPADRSRTGRSARADGAAHKMPTALSRQLVLLRVAQAGDQLCVIERVSRRRTGRGFVERATRSTKQDQRAMFSQVGLAGGAPGARTLNPRIKSPLLYH